MPTGTNRYPAADDDDCASILNRVVKFLFWILGIRWHFAGSLMVVISAGFGDQKRLEFTVIGSAVNLSAKLEKHNKVTRSRAITTAEFLEEAKSQGYVPSHDIDIETSNVEGTSGNFELAILHR